MEDVKQVLATVGMAPRASDATDPAGIGQALNTVAAYHRWRMERLKAPPPGKQRAYLEALGAALNRLLRLMPTEEDDGGLGGAPGERVQLGVVQALTAGLDAARTLRSTSPSKPGGAPELFDEHELADMVERLRDLCQVVEGSLDAIEPSPERGPRYVDPAFLRNLGRIYRDVFGREPRVSRPTSRGATFGPFVRFCVAVHHRLGERMSEEAMAQRIRRAPKTLT